MQRTLAIMLLALGWVGVGAKVRAQDLEPRAYANTPVGLNFVVASYAYSEGGVVVDPAIALDNANIRIDTGVLAYARSFSAWDRSAKWDVTVPCASLSGTAEVRGQQVKRDVSGLGDPRLRMSLNLYGAPALSQREARAYRQDIIIGASLEVSAPIGQYDPDKLVNLGSNRWMIKPEIGLSKAVGRWTFELAAAVALYEDNDDFFGGRHREQDSIFSLQGSLIYSFGGDIWAALGGTYYTGGRTTIDGVRGNDLQENTRVGAIVSIPIARNQSLKFVANSGVSTRTGSDFDRGAIAWQYRWEGG